MMNTQVEQISSVHSLGTYRFSQSMDSYITCTENQSAQAEVVAGILK